MMLSLMASLITCGGKVKELKKVSFGHMVKELLNLESTEVMCVMLNSGQ